MEIFSKNGKPELITKKRIFDNEDLPFECWLER